MVHCIKTLKLDVEVVDQLCPNCLGKYLKIHFRKNTGLDSKQGCVDCNEELSSLLETKKSYIRRGRGGRGRSRGRGRRGGHKRGGNIRDGGTGPVGKPKAHSLADYF